MTRLVLCNCFRAPFQRKSEYAEGRARFCGHRFLHRSCCRGGKKGWKKIDLGFNQNDIFRNMSKDVTLKSQLFALDGGLWPRLLCLQRTVRGWVSLSDLHGTFFNEFCLGARRPSASSVLVVEFFPKINES